MENVGKEFNMFFWTWSLFIVVAAKAAAGGRGGRAMGGRTRRPCRYFLNLATVRNRATFVVRCFSFFIHILILNRPVR